MESNNEYALITGASLGIGREIAKEFARRKINTLLIALDTPDLYDVQKDLRDNYDIRAECFPTDLTDPRSAAMIYTWCKENDYVVKYLINNAGFGASGFFESVPLNRYYQMIDLNIKAYVALTHLFLPDLKSLGEGYIMNTSSMEANLPVPYKAVYTGTKNFVYAFSMALSKEVQRSGVRVSILCPGPVPTNEEGLKRLETQGKRGQMLVQYPDQVASYAVKNLLHGRLIIHPGRMNRWINRCHRLLPVPLKMRILEKMFRSYTEVSPSK
jgi:short-subunit dehydrogenase